MYVSIHKAMYLTYKQGSKDFKVIHYILGHLYYYV